MRIIAFIPLLYLPLYPVPKLSLCKALKEIPYLTGTQYFCLSTNQDCRVWREKSAQTRKKQLQYICYCYFCSFSTV